MYGMEGVVERIGCPDLGWLDDCIVVVIIVVVVVDRRVVDYQGYSVGGG
jgi:hypothetical protein